MGCLLNPLIILLAVIGLVHVTVETHADLAQEHAPRFAHPDHARLDVHQAVRRHDGERAQFLAKIIVEGNPEACLGRGDIQILRAHQAHDHVATQAIGSPLDVSLAIEKELYIEFRKDGKPVDPAPWWSVGVSGRTGNDS